MLKIQPAADLAATALMVSPALAQAPAPTQPAGPGQAMTRMPQDPVRGSRLMGLAVHGTDADRAGAAGNTTPLPQNVNPPPNMPRQ